MPGQVAMTIGIAGLFLRTSSACTNAPATIRSRFKWASSAACAAKSDELGRRTRFSMTIFSPSMYPCLDFLRGVSLPIQVFAHDPERLTGAIGLRGITRILLVCQIRVIHKRPRRFHQVDSAWTFALCQFRSPGSREHSLAEVDPGRPPLGVVGGIAGLEQVPGLQVRPGAMVELS